MGKVIETRNDEKSVVKWFMFQVQHVEPEVK